MNKEREPSRTINLRYRLLKRLWSPWMLSLAFFVRVILLHIAFFALRCARLRFEPLTTRCCATRHARIVRRRRKLSLIATSAIECVLTRLRFEPFTTRCCATRHALSCLWYLRQRKILVVLQNVLLEFRLRRLRYAQVLPQRFLLPKSVTNVLSWNDCLLPFPSFSKLLQAKKMTNSANRSHKRT